MTCTGKAGVLRRWHFLLAAALACGTAALASASDPQAVARFVAQADSALKDGDGVAAEMRLRDALDAGAARDAIAARMGEAFIQQGDRLRAREWLEPAQFAKGQEARGWRTLGMLERLDGNLPAAGRAYDRALAFTPRDPLLWVDIGRLRYSGGEQAQAIAAADMAVGIGPDNVRALEFRGQLVRDQLGQVAALAWFERALAHAPDDIAVLGEYAATLGEAGRARAMLAVTRRMLEHEPDNPRAFYLQAVLAARGGRYDVARRLLDRTGSALRDVPAAILLDGALNLHVGNAAQATEQFDRLVRMQPANERAALLLARALYDSGQYQVLVERFAVQAARPDAPVYLLILMGRAYEASGQRDRAAIWLDRAAMAGAPVLAPIRQDEPLGVLALRWRDAPHQAGTVVPYIRKLLDARDLAGAEAIAERVRQANPGTSEAWALAGDVQLARGAFVAAAERYDRAARIRLTDGLLVRMAEAMGRAGRVRETGMMVDRYLAANPQNRTAMRLAAAAAQLAADRQRARALLESLRASGGANDAQVQSELALLCVQAGDPVAAREAASAGYALHRNGKAQAQALAAALEASGRRGGGVAALRAKLARMQADFAMGGRPPQARADASR